MSAVKTENLCAGYGKITVAGGISFSVNRGEVLTVLGANGAGKSTVLKSIASQLPLIDGKVYIGERSISDMNQRDISKKLSLLLTDRITAERMTCFDVVATGRYPYTNRFGILSDSDVKAVKEAMSLTGVLYLQDTDFRFVSDGQRQCVMLARAVAQEPEVMLLDEPTSFLDINHKCELLSLLRKLALEKNISVIQSLHELDLAQRFSDKILCIKNAKADRFGTPESIFSGDYISSLYGISNFSNFYGTYEADRLEGSPQVFVIGGGGMGIPVYRLLRRKEVPFAVGVIHENDIDFPVAQALASEVVTEQAFEEISEESLEKALEVMKGCSKAVCCNEKFGRMNMKNRVLLETALKHGKLTDIENI